MTKKKEVYVPKVKNYPIIKVIHNRVPDNQCGGSTIVAVELEFGVIQAGIAECWALEAYNKVKGKSIAFGRLMRAIRPGRNTLNCKKIEKVIRAKIGNIDEKLFKNARDGIKPVDPVKVYVPEVKTHD